MNLPQNKVSFDKLLINHSSCSLSHIPLLAPKHFDIRESYTENVMSLLISLESPDKVTSLKLHNTTFWSKPSQQESDSDDDIWDEDSEIPMPYDY